MNDWIKEGGIFSVCAKLRMFLTEVQNMFTAHFSLSKPSKKIRNSFQTNLYRNDFIHNYTESKY